jgi:hypothetical protein
MWNDVEKSVSTLVKEYFSEQVIFQLNLKNEMQSAI